MAKQQANTQAAKGNMVAIIAMFFLFAMISFVTNLAAPIGTIWAVSYTHLTLPTTSRVYISGGGG